MKPVIFISILLLVSVCAFGQGATVLFPPLSGPQGQSIPFALLTFCTSPATFDSLGNCTNTVTVFQNSTLVTPYSSAIRTDGLGNFPPNVVTTTALWFSAATNYCYTATGSNILHSVNVCTPFSIPIASGSSPTFSTVTITGNENLSSSSFICWNSDSGITRAAAKSLKMGDCAGSSDAALAIGSVTVTGASTLNTGSFGGTWTKGNTSSPYILRLTDPGTLNNQVIGFNIEQEANHSGSANWFDFGQATELFTPTADTQTFTGDFVGVYGTGIHFGSGNISSIHGGDFEGFNAGSATASLVVGVAATANNGGVAAGSPVQTPSNNGNATTVRAFDGVVKNLSSGTITTAVALYGGTALNTGGGAITNNYGLLIGSQTAGSNNWAISAGQGKSEFADIIGIGTNGSNGTADLFISGTPAAASGTTQSGVTSTQTCTSGATTECSAVIALARTTAAVHTVTTLTGVHVEDAVKGATSTITEQDGIKIDTLTQGGTNFAIKTGGNNISLGGLISVYNGLSLLKNGVPSNVAAVDLASSTATTGTLTLWACTAAPVRVSWNAKVVTAGSVSSTLGPLTIVYTDPDGVAQTVTAPASGPGGTIATTSTTNVTTSLLLGMPLLINCKAGTNVTYNMGYTANAAASMAYNLHILVEQN